ncbi:MAG: GNAT family N-acetyltransferase [Acidobacteriia bacterium]|nr:GNAT family N-acetyltransferase [Terriglobia bacterium]
MRIATERLLLRATNPQFAEAVAEYLVRNREAHREWNPPMPDRLFTQEGQHERLVAAAESETDGSQVGWFLSLKGDEKVIGHIRFSQIVRGPFCNAMLGYSIDSGLEGRGLMREALEAALSDVFSPRVMLHRVQANVRPENTRSLGLLDRLGFVREGYARNYLFIGGAWRDHVMTARINPAWRASREPSCS